MGERNFLLYSRGELKVFIRARNERPIFVRPLIKISTRISSDHFKRQINVTVHVREMYYFLLIENTDVSRCSSAKRHSLHGLMSGIKTFLVPRFREEGKGVSMSQRSLETVFSSKFFWRWLFDPIWPKGRVKWKYLWTFNNNINCVTISLQNSGDAILNVTMKNDLTRVKTLAFQ